MSEKENCKASLCSRAACGRCDKCRDNLAEVQATLDFYQRKNSPPSVEHILIESPFFGKVGVTVSTLKNQVTLTFGGELIEISVDEKTANLMAELVYLHMVKIKLGI